MFNRGFGGFGGYGGGGNFGNQFSSSRFHSGFVGGPGGGSGLMGMNRGGFRGGFGGMNRFGGQTGGGFAQSQQRGGLFGRGTRGGSFSSRGGAKGSPKNVQTNSKQKAEEQKTTAIEKKEEKSKEKKDENGKDTSTNEDACKEMAGIKPRPASMDFEGTVKKTPGANAKGDSNEKQGDQLVGTPPWEAKKKAENKQQEQKTDKLGAPWEKKKNEEFAQKAGNAPWENKKENKATPPWTKKPEQKELPPWQQKDANKPEVIDLETSPWQQEENEEMGPPPWLQQQEQNVGKDTPKPLFGKVKEEPLFDSRKRSYGSMQQIKPSGVAPSIKAEQTTLEQRPRDTRVVLDDFNSDLNLVIGNDGYAAETLNKPMGFCFCWGGARATFGVTRGKVCFEVKITKNLPTDFGDDHEEADPHVVRVGWSVDSHGFQLGEDPDSFGFGGTGKFSANCRFSNYGQTYGIGDVVMALLDLEAKPPNISFAKNGRWFGVAHRLGGWPQGVKEKALFPHVLSKNCAVELNFGQREPWFKPPPGFVFIEQVPLHQKVRGMLPSAKVTDCEMIMIVGLPGAGKTTWGINMQKENFAKRYNIIGTDTLIDKMKVNGLPRKNNYHGRWDRLIQKATECLNKLFQIGSKKCRNYILDQTNVYATARKRKMRNFNGFQRKCAVLVTSDPELERRSYQRTYVDGKFVPDEAVMEMKANFSLPHESDPHVDQIIWIEFGREQAYPLIEQYNREGQINRPSRSKAFPHDNRSQSSDRRDSRDVSEGRNMHQRSFSDRGSQGERGRTWERNQDRRTWEQEERGGWGRDQTGFQGGPGGRDQGLSDKFHGRDRGFARRDERGHGDREQGSQRDEEDNNRQQEQRTSWQQNPGNVRDQWAERHHGARENSPAARPEDIPFKKPKVEARDAGYGDTHEGRNQTWQQMGTGGVKQEPMDPGYERFGADGNRYFGNRDVDYRNTGERFPRHGDAERGMNAPFDRDDRAHGGNRFGGPGDRPMRGQADHGFQGNRFSANRNNDRFRVQDRFPRDGADDQFRATENQSIKIENPFIKTEENPFLVRLAQLDKEKPLRFDQYVKNADPSEVDLNKPFGIGRGGGRYGQDRRGGANRFGGEKRFDDNRFGGSRRNESFLVQGPGGFNKDRQDTYGQSGDRTRQDNRYGDGGRHRSNEEDRNNRRAGDRESFGGQGPDDKDRWNRPGSYQDESYRDATYYPKHRQTFPDQYDQDRPRQEGRHRDWHGGREEWSGGGDGVEWQGGSGNASQMRSWNTSADPNESGDGRDSSRTDRPDARWGQQGSQERWNTGDKEQNWNRDQGQTWVQQSESNSSKDIDYRQQGKPQEEKWEDYTRRYDQQQGERNYEGRNSGIGPNDDWDQLMNRVQRKDDWRQPGDDASKSTWQGGSSDDTSKDNRWSNTGAGEEWRGGWGNTQQQQQQQEQGPTSGADKQSDDNSRWGSDQYGNNYGQGYSYGAGYTNPGDEAHESYATETKTSNKSQEQEYGQQAYNQKTDQGYASEWNRYSQQGWDGYGQEASKSYEHYGEYSEWNQVQQAGSAETAKVDDVSKKGETDVAASSTSQPQYSSWSEYKSSQSSNTAASPGDREPSTMTSPKKAEKQYGHYSTTATSVEQEKNDAQATWDSSSYGYGAPPPPESSHTTNTYAYGSGNVTGNQAAQISQASILGAAANISLPPNLDLNAIQQSLAAHGFTQPPPPPPGPTGAILFPGGVAYHSGSGLAGVAPGMYPVVRRQ